MRERDFKSCKVTFEVSGSLDSLKCCTLYRSAGSSEWSCSHLPGLRAALSSSIEANLFRTFICLPCLCFGVGSPSWQCNQSGGWRMGAEASTENQVPFTPSYVLRLPCLSCTLLLLSLYDFVPISHKIVCLNLLSSHFSLKQLSRQIVK